MGKSPKRTRLVKQYKSELAEFLSSNQRIKFDPIKKPEISVLIPVYNSAYHTLRCLKSLAADQSCALEVIVFNNSSSDETSELLQRFENIVVINSEKNLGFVGATNAAAHQARGRLVLMMNNDITILKGQLRDAAQLFATEKNVGAVGGLIKLATGRIQEAGAIIYRDGTTNGFLRNRKGEYAEGRFVRDVDYCSGAFLLLDRKYFIESGGLDEVFAPGYYEETDLCMRLRAAGLRIIYTPQIVLEHFEFGSLASGAAFERMARNRKIFVDRWKKALDAENYAKPFSSSFAASRRLISHPRVIIVLDSAKSLPGVHSAMLELIQSGWHIGMMIIGQKNIGNTNFPIEEFIKIEFLPDQSLKKLHRQRPFYFDHFLAIGSTAKTKISNYSAQETKNISSEYVATSLHLGALENFRARISQIL